MYKQLTLLIMKHGCNLLIMNHGWWWGKWESAWLYLPLTFSRLGLRNFGVGAWAHTLKVYKVFTKVGQGPWLKRTRCLGPASVIHCTPLSTLSFWVSLLPRAFGYNKTRESFWTFLFTEAKPSLCTWTKNWFSVTVCGEAGKNSFIALLVKRSHTGLMSSELCVSQPGGDSEKFYSNGSERLWSVCGPPSDWLVVR